MENVPGYEAQTYPWLIANLTRLADSLSASVLPHCGVVVFGVAEPGFLGAGLAAGVPPAGFAAAALPARSILTWLILIGRKGRSFSSFPIRAICLTKATVDRKSTRLNSSHV